MAEFSNWKYYKHAVIPAGAPHETVDVEPIQTGKIWQEYPNALLARWATEFDCGQETNWWYVIKDTPFDISALKAKRRYEIRKGIKHFKVHQISPKDYAQELFNVQCAAYSAWPEKYRPTADYHSFIKSLSGWEKNQIYAAFDRDDGMLCGYARCTKFNESFIDFNVLLTIPEYERYGVNAAIVFGILEDNAFFLEQGGYICDGSRNINHETKFQNYLEKYFGFRKAYCRLNICLKPGFGAIIKCLYPFRGVFRKLDMVGPVHKLNALLTMKEFAEETGD